MADENKNLYEDIKERVLEEYRKGNVVFVTIEGLMSIPIADFIKQPADGILYDLNRDEVVVLTMIKERKWVNDYAVAKVIRYLKEQLDEANKRLVEAGIK